MRVPSPVVLAAAVWVLARVAGAQPVIDDKRDLSCRPEHVAQCDLQASCTMIALEEIELPSELRVSFVDKKLSSPEGDRTSPIHWVDRGEAQLVLQGSQNGRGWSMVIDRTTGFMSGTIADAEGAFVVVGTCAGR